MTASTSAFTLERVHACPICNEATGSVLHIDARDRWFGTTGSWTFRKCDRCGGLWLDPRPTASTLPSIYAHYYTHVGGNAHLAQPSELRDLRRRLPWHAVDRRGDIAYLDGLPPGEVLEVGCGDGSRLARLTGGGWSAAGIDFDQEAVEAARRTFDGDVRVGTIHDIEGTAVYDAIVMFHVLEHLDDPLAELRRAQELLRPCGVLSITTPNASSWLHRIYGRRWRGLEPPRHLQVFTEPGLRSILAAAGFSRTEVFTTARNASLMSSASESSYGTSSWVRRMTMIVKGELLQALESARIRWSPFCGEELVALASSEPLRYGDRNRRVEPCA